jgi:hypothetical protein
MCTQKWADINFAKVSLLCLDRHKRAFLKEGKTVAGATWTAWPTVSSGPSKPCGTASSEW